MRNGVFDYLDKNRLVVLDNPVRIKEEAERFHGDFIDHYNDRRKGRSSGSSTGYWHRCRWKLC